MFSREIAIVRPGTVGVDESRLTRALELLRSGVGNAFPGATICAYRKGKCFIDLAIGTLDGEIPTTPESLYDLASLTKPLATAASILTLVEQGLLTYQQALGDLVGETSGEWGTVSIRHLVTHTSGLPAWIACYKGGAGLDAAVKAVLSVPIAERPRPGEKYEYSCLNYILLAQIIEIVSGKPIDRFAQENLFAPLGLLDLTYQPDPILQPRIAPTRSEEGPEETFPIVLRGTVHDGNARGIGGVSGNAGLFGTARDVARFGNALLHPEAEARLFGAAALARVWENQISGIGGQTFLFFASGNDINPTGELLSSRTVGHSGYTGTVLVIDPTYDIVIAVLTNSVYSTADAAKTNWLKLRRRFLNAFAAALI